MKINLFDFVKDEVEIQNFTFVEGLIFKRQKIRSLYFERVSIKKLLELSFKYFGKEGEEEKIINFRELCRDIYKVLKTDPRNFWLKERYILQQPQDHLILIVGIMCQELLGSKKKNQNGTLRKSPLERFMETL